MIPIPVYIAAGGQSVRFGSDKARALLHDRPLIVNVAEALRPIASRTVAVADRPGKYADLGVMTIGDSTPASGPLGALEAACLHRIDHDGPGWLVLGACDLVVVRPRWIRTLAREAEPGRLAIAFRDERWQPMPALYHTDALPIITERLAARRLDLQGLLDAARARGIDRPSDWPRVHQANTPDDLLRASAEPPQGAPESDA